MFVNQRLLGFIVGMAFGVKVGEKIANALIAAAAICLQRTNQHVIDPKWQIRAQLRFERQFLGGLCGHRSGQGIDIKRL